ncbi:methyl-accepting chemotaxis protein, partial [Ectorhizobium quercum]|uniref:methyl-accepting chemotaxis protein n=1 Tax=Ectorhizobium quercum TaxID=2965071 RepID=UPI0027953A7F
MSFLENARIRTKILSVIVPVCLIGIGGVAFMSNNFKAADTDYSNYIAIDASAAVETFRANSAIIGFGLASYEYVQMREQSLDTSAVEKRYAGDVDTYFRRMETAKTLVPSMSQKVDELTALARTAAERADRVFELGKAGRLEEARRAVQEVGPAIETYRESSRVWNAQNMQAVIDGSETLTARTDRTILMSLIALGIVFLAGILASLLMVSRGITGPIERLRGRMLSLAGGETQAEIAGLGRKDEVGEMAQAVSVFRDNALERIRLEREAEANRSLSEKERIEREAQRAREAEEVRFAVDNLAAGLSKLSDGDVSYRIAQPFAATLDAVRNDFNASAEKLQSA